jgi:hypothetical protein
MVATSNSLNLAFYADVIYAIGHIFDIALPITQGKTIFKEILNNERGPSPTGARAVALPLRVAHQNPLHPIWSTP